MRFTGIFLRIFIILVVYPALSLSLPLYEIFRLAVSAWGSVLSGENMERKVVLITGAASGIGEQIAYEYAKRKGRLALVDINEDGLRQVSSRARSKGSPGVISLKADVSNPEHSNHFIQQAVQHFGQLDHLVNNAGTTGAFFDFFENLDDPALFNPAIASKAALISFYETLRVEMGSDIGITIVTPGLIDTPLTRGEFMSKMGSVMRNLPSTPAEECAKQIVKSGCRGDAYLRVPHWVSVGILLKALYPELASCLTRRAFLRKRTLKKSL